jgi:poly(3-hydroxyalkanoate) synthetase
LKWTEYADPRIAKTEIASGHLIEIINDSSRPLIGSWPNRSPNAIDIKRWIVRERLTPNSLSSDH